MEMYVFFVILNQCNLNILHLDPKNFVLPMYQKFTLKHFLKIENSKKCLNITYFLLILLFSISRSNF